jgi:exopolysaccharide production protein ExoZ
LGDAPEQSSKRIVSIQVCRGLAVLLVVLAHLESAERKYCATNHLHLFQYGVLGVDLFFVISGVVISSVASGRFRSRRNAALFLYHRFTRIFPIYWIYSSIVLTAFIFQPGWINAEGGHRVNILASYLLIPIHRPMLLLQAWTLSSELYFYLVFAALLLLVSERAAGWLLAVWGIAVVGLKLWVGFSPYPIVQTVLSPLTLEFLAGCFIFYLYRRVRLSRFAGALLVIAALLWLAGVLAYNTHVHGGDAKYIEDAPWLRPLLYGTFSGLFLSGAMALEHSGVRFFSFLASIGDHSYSIYLSHILVIEIIARIVSSWHGSIVLIAFVSLPAVLLVGYLSYTFVERPLMRLFYKPNPPLPQTSPPC